MIKFEEGQTYRNTRMMDTYMRVTAVHAEEPDYTKLEVQWLNLRNGSEFGRDAITVTCDNIGDWVKVERHDS